MMADIEKETVDFQPTYDDSSDEPTVLPTVFPNLLVNGAAGHRGGHGHQHPAPQPGRGGGRPHLPAREPGPDPRRAPGRRDRAHPRARLPDRRLHLRPGRDPPGLPHRPRLDRHARAGRDRDRARATASRSSSPRSPTRSTRRGSSRRSPSSCSEKRIEGISDIRDESDREGMRIVIDLKKGEPAQVILNNLYKHTQLQDTFGIIMLAIVDQRPRVLNLLEACELFLDFRREVVRRRTAFELRKAEARAHILEGLRHRPRPPRRGDRADPRVQDARPRRATGLIAPLRPHRDPGRRDPRDAAPAPHRPRAPEDRRRARGAADPDRRPQGHPGLAAARRRRSWSTSSRRSARSTATRAAPRSWTRWTRSRSRT